MPLVNTKEMFLNANKNHYAVGSFNCDTLDMAQAVLTQSNHLNSPVIVAFSEGSREFMHPGNIKELLNIVTKDIKIPYAIHLDHGKNFDICKACIDEGFTSVMIDTGDVSYSESIRLTKEVVEYAHKFNVCVEGELGELEINKEEYKGFTDPYLAIRFIKETGIDSLAISIGTKHGTNKNINDFRWDILKIINEELGLFPLVLHGSSSIPSTLIDEFNKYGGNIHNTKGINEELLIKAAQFNVAKINIATDFRLTYVTNLRKTLSLINDHYEPRRYLVPTHNELMKLVEHKLTKVLLSSNKIG